MTSFLTALVVFVVASFQHISLTYGFEERLNFEVRPRIDEARLGHSVVVDCVVGGSPNPVIHWLFNGLPIKQEESSPRINISSPLSTESRSSGSSSSSRWSAAVEEGSVKPTLRLGSTKARLYLDHVGVKDEGEYTCVASTPRETIKASTNLIISRSAELSRIILGKRHKSNSGVPARIVMWTATRLEFEGTDVQLFCRAQGVPTPTIRWYTPLDVQVDGSSPQYQVLENGDLLIKDVNWADNMGVYRCIADNIGGADEVSTFLYPTTM